MGQKLFIITRGLEDYNLGFAFPQLIRYFSAIEGLSFRCIKTDLLPITPPKQLGLDQVSANAASGVGKRIVQALQELDIVQVHLESDLFPLFAAMSTLREMVEEAQHQGRRCIAYLPAWFDQRHGGISINYLIASDLIEGGLDVRLGLFGGLPGYSGHLRLNLPYAVLPYASIPTIGSGLAELIIQHGWSISSLLEKPPTDFSFAANHIRRFLNDCIIGGVFSDILPWHRLVPGTDKPSFEQKDRDKFQFRYNELNRIEGCRNEALFAYYAVNANEEVYRRVLGGVD